ncbi:MAG TPA: ice-binding family protein [Ilumatobacter sp.]|nr:ice-binding family protein [Ilumatobacter sp.]
MPAPRPSHTTRFSGCLPRLAAVVAIAAGTALALASAQTVSASIVPTVELATSADYSVLAATTVTNTNPSVIGQSVGLSPGTSITGFPPGIVLPPATIQAANAVTLQAQSDLTIAYDDAAGRDVEFSHPNPDLVGQTLLPGVHAATAMAPLALSGQLVLDGQNNPDAVFIFQTDSTLITSTGSTIALINGASECNVFWQVGSSATLGSGSFFVGTILALTSITVESSVVVHGRALARNGAVTLDNNVFTQPSCEPATDLVPTATAPATTTTVPATTPATTVPLVPTTVSTEITTPEEAATTVTVNVTDITLPGTGASTTAQSGIGFAAVLIGLGALMIARRRQSA